MLVKFVSSTDGAMLMFADVAAPLLRFLGKTPAPRGVFAADEVPRLLAALVALHDGTPGGALLDGDAHAAREAAAHEVPVSLRQRVAPMIELLRHTAAHEGYLLWEAPPGFGSAGG
jgi:hypothetical protein